jgi:hypothetical protein
MMNKSRIIAGACKSALTESLCLLLYAFKATCIIFWNAHWRSILHAAFIHINAFRCITTGMARLSSQCMRCCPGLSLTLRFDVLVGYSKQCRHHLYEVPWSSVGGVVRMVWLGGPPHTRRTRRMLNPDKKPHFPRRTFGRDTNLLGTFSERVFAIEFLLFLGNHRGS